VSALFALAPALAIALLLSLRRYPGERAILALRRVRAARQRAPHAPDAAAPRRLATRRRSVLASARADRAPPFRPAGTHP
jgi:hypothetical protein